MKKKLVIIHYYQYDAIKLTTWIGNLTTISCVRSKTNVKRQSDNRTDIEMRDKAIKLNKNNYGTAITIVTTKNRKRPFFNFNEFYSISVFLISWVEYNM